MGVKDIPMYREDGRLRGCYVYMLLCRDDGPVYVKVGISSNPHKRLQTLRGGCPVPPRRYCTMEVFSRAYAKTIERTLHEAMLIWRVHGEWFRVPMEEKSDFNAAWKVVLAHFERPGWPGRWDQIAVAPYVAEGKRKQRYYKKMFFRRGKAQKDFERDLRLSEQSRI